MSEIQRYAVIETALCIGGNVHDGEVLMVRADEHDRELAELQATIARLESKLNRAINLDFERREEIAKLTAEIERLKGGPVSVGYKLVPLTPTAAMVQAGINTRCADDEHQDYRDVYAAMIGAAP